MPDVVWTAYDMKVFLPVFQWTSAKAIILKYLMLEKLIV